MLRNKLYLYSDEIFQVPHNLNYGGYVLQKFVQYKDAVALTDPKTDESVTYADLAQLTVDVALSLVHMGVKRGDVVGICSEEKLTYAPTALGIMCAGAAFTPIDFTGSAAAKYQANLVKPKIMFISERAYKEYQEILSTIGTISKFIVYNDEELSGAIKFKDFLNQHGKVEDFIPVQVGASDVAFINFSSGTTGMPKGVIKTHLNLVHENIFFCKSNIIFLGKRTFTPREVWLTSLYCLSAGARDVFTTDIKENISEILGIIQKYKVEILLQLPSIIYDLVHYAHFDNFDVSSVQTIVTGAAPLKIALADVVKLRFPNIQKKIYQIYGCTEAGFAVKDDHLTFQKPGSVGRPLACCIKIVDLQTGKPLEPNQHGEICILSASLSTGYISNDPDIKLPIDREGFYRTGDIGYYDDDHYIYLVDRYADIIKYKGYQVCPTEIEEVLHQHPAVLDVGVVGLPDDRCYEVATAFVVLRPEASIAEDELTAYANTHLSEAAPLAGGVRFVTSLPRVSRGKLDRKALKLL